MAHMSEQRVFLPIFNNTKTPRKLEKQRKFMQDLKSRITEYTNLSKGIRIDA